jgi:hypothetical protein
MWHVRVRTFAMETQQTNFLCTAELNVTLNNIKISNVAQQYFGGEFVSPATVHRTQVLA